MLVSLLSALAAWVSHPTVFIFGAISLSLFPELWKASIRGRIAWFAGNAIVSVSFVLLYLLSIRLQHNPLLFQYWIDKGAFPDYSKPWTLPAWLVYQLVSVCDNPFQPLGIIVLFLAILGTIAWWRQKQWKLLIATLGPIVLTLIAALLMQFPFKGSRVTLFMTPGLVLLATRGIGMLRPMQFGGRKGDSFDWRNLPWAAPALLVIWCGALAAFHLFAPQRKSHMRPVVAYLKDHYQAGDAIYVLGISRDYEFHTYWRHPPVPIKTGLDFSPDRRPDHPFWIVTGFNPSKSLRVIADPLEQARTVATETEQEIGIGGAAIRFEPREK
jgi:hypothetical protein